MATRETSIETYNQIKAEGLLGKMQIEVLGAVVENWPCTSGEAFDRMRDHRERSPLSQTRARFTELRDNGVIEEVGERICKISGRNAIVWAPTGKLPCKPPKKISAPGAGHTQGRAVTLCGTCERWGDSHSFYCGCMFPDKLEAIVIKGSRGNA
jgi:hypothetical protein